MLSGLSDCPHAPSSFALSSTSLSWSHAPSAHRYHSTAAGSAAAQNASSTATYEAVPARPRALTRSMPPACGAAAPGAAEGSAGSVGKEGKDQRELSALSIFSAVGVLVRCGCEAAATGGRRRSCDLEAAARTGSRHRERARGAAVMKAALLPILCILRAPQNTVKVLILVSKEEVNG